ncbi:TPA: CsbD family protein, partial [Proteus mirabilis]|nr:CsbD family protein [Proteus mirabilis]
MLNNKASGDWNLFKGKVKEKWGKLTHDELDIIEGTREQLIGKLQEHYG